MPPLLALSSIRVLDLATLFPAPLLAAMLGDLGADVVKVETPQGDPLRRVGRERDGETVAWRLAGRNKRSVVVSPETAADLASVADIVIVNQPTKVLARNKWDFESVWARNPGVVYTAVSAFGSTGPYADLPGNGSVAEAFGGFAYLNGAPDGPPVLPSLALGDTLVAMAGVGQVLAALFARDASREADRDADCGGQGAFIDLAIYESVLGLLASSIAGWSPGEVPPSRRGSRIEGAAPRNVYRCGDGEWIALSGATDEQVSRILGIIGSSDGPARRASAAQRVAEEADALDAAVATWIGARDRDDVLDALVAARIPVAPVNSLADIAADDQVRARGSLQAALGVEHRRAPDIGEHTAEVLEDWLPPDLR